VKNLKLLNYALRMCWKWMAMLEEDKPWKDLDFVIAEEAEEMFQRCIKCEVGIGEASILDKQVDQWEECGAIGTKPDAICGPGGQTDDSCAGAAWRQLDRGDQGGAIGAGNRGVHLKRGG
jgi:hypothetical protein